MIRAVQQSQELYLQVLLRVDRPAFPVDQQRNPQPGFELSQTLVLLVFFLPLLARQRLQVFHFVIFHPPHRTCFVAVLSLLYFQMSLLVDLRIDPHLPNSGLQRTYYVDRPAGSVDPVDSPHSVAVAERFQAVLC